MRFVDRRYRIGEEAGGKTSPRALVAQLDRARLS